MGEESSPTILDGVIHTFQIEVEESQRRLIRAFPGPEEDHWCLRQEKAQQILNLLKEYDGIIKSSR